MDNTDLAKEWLRFAFQDIGVAKHSLSFYPLPIEAICYHCQQASEKALKAVLVYFDEEVPRTHDLYRLLEQCSAFNQDLLSELAEQCKRLSSYISVARYPSNIDLNEAEMLLALEYAEKVLVSVIKVINFSS